MIENPALPFILLFAQTLPQPTSEDSSVQTRKTAIGRETTDDD